MEMKKEDKNYETPGAINAINIMGEMKKEREVTKQEREERRNGREETKKVREETKRPEKLVVPISDLDKSKEPGSGRVKLSPIQTPTPQGRGDSQFFKAECSVSEKKDVGAIGAVEKKVENKESKELPQIPKVAPKQAIPTIKGRQPPPPSLSKKQVVKEPPKEPTKKVSKDNVKEIIQPPKEIPKPPIIPPQQAPKVIPVPPVKEETKEPLKSSPDNQSLPPLLIKPLPKSTPPNNKDQILHTSIYIYIHIYIYIYIYVYRGETRRSKSKADSSYSSRTP